MVTVRDLLNLVQNNCPEVCYDQILISDNLTGPTGKVKQVRYRMHENQMVLELVFDGDSDNQQTSAAA